MTQQRTRLAVLLFALLLTPLLQACGRDERAATPEPRAGGIVTTVEAGAPAADAATEVATEAAAAGDAAVPEAEADTASVAAAETATEATGAATEVAVDSGTASATDAATETTSEAATEVATEVTTEAATEAATEDATEAATEAPGAAPEETAEPAAAPGVGTEFTAALPVRLYAFAGADAPVMAIYDAGSSFAVIEPDLEYTAYPVVVEDVSWVRVRAADGLAGWVPAGTMD